MKVLWSKSPLTAAEIIDAITNDNPARHPRTTKTYLNRLVAKEALGFTKEGRGYIYRPLVTEGECVKAVSQSFLDRIFGGSLKPMLAHFVEQQPLSPEEVKELKRLLEKKK